jgi:hypothetical protein
MCYRLSNLRGHRDGEIDVGGRRRFQKVKCTEVDCFREFQENDGEDDDRGRFVGL